MIKKEIIKEIIRDFHRSQLPETKQRDLSIPVNTKKIVTITGVRRSGKTYILFETIKKLLSLNVPKNRMLYLNFEDERLDLSIEQVELILQSYRELYPDIDLSKCYLFFDEVQNVAGWERFIRRVYDGITKNIFITGSNSRLLSKEISTSLRGRTLTYEIFPLSFKEYLRFYGIEPDIYHSETKAKIIGLFERFLIEGGFPELPMVSEHIKFLTLQEYFHVMLYRDMVERFKITNITVLKYFLKRLFENISSPLSVNKIYNELKSHGYRISKNMLYEYLQYAEDIYLFQIIRKYNPSILKQELGEKKVYAIDNGILNSATYSFLKDYGKLLENLIFMEFRKKGKSVFFYKNKKECDFLIPDDKNGEVIQVTYSVEDISTREREIGGLIEACRLSGFKRATLLTLAEEAIFNIEGIKINVLPAYKWVLENL